MSKCKPELGEGRYGGRGVAKNDYEAEHQRARARTTTEQYAAVRREHPEIERRVNEVMNHQGARYGCGWLSGGEKIRRIMFYWNG